MSGVIRITEIVRITAVTLMTKVVVYVAALNQIKFYAHTKPLRCHPDRAGACLPFRELFISSSPFPRILSAAIPGIGASRTAAATSRFPAVLHKLPHNKGNNHGKHQRNQYRREILNNKRNHCITAFLHWPPLPQLSPMPLEYHPSVCV